MNRRGFLRSLVGGVAATVAVRTFPFRVYSFPTEITYPVLDIFSARLLSEDVLIHELITQDEIYRYFKHHGEIKLLGVVPNLHRRMPFTFVSP